MRREHNKLLDFYAFVADESMDFNICFAPKIQDILIVIVTMCDSI